MPRTLRAVSLILLLTVLLGVTVLLTFAPDRAGHSVHDLTPSLIVSVLLFAVPMLSLYLWVSLRARQFARLTEATRRIAAGNWGESLRSLELGDEVSGIIPSIEEMRRTLIEQKGRNEEQRMVSAEILNGIGEGLLAIDRRKNVVLSNRRLEELLPDRHGLIGRSFMEVVRSSALIGAFDRALAGVESTERTLMEVAGTLRHIEIRVFPVSASSEIAAVALFIDVSHIEQLERVRRDFIADFSHEVRTPLAGVRSAVDTLTQPGLTADQEQHLMEIVLRQVLRIEKLVAGAAELKQIESGELTLVREPFDIARLLQELCREFTARAAQMAVEVTCEGDSVIIVADPLKIQQIFSNLLDNALKHGGAGGVVEVQLSTTENEAVVRVMDRGPGIAPEERDRIFHRFYRIDKSRSGVPGTGLGLAIARHLVLLHGGTIEMTSERGSGTSFEVRLPLS